MHRPNATRPPEPSNTGRRRREPLGSSLGPWLLLCLLALLGSACEPQELRPGDPDAPLAAPAPPDSGWLSVDHAEGEAWEWAPDPSLRVILVHPPEPGTERDWTPGLYVEWGEELVGFETTRAWREDTGLVPLLVASPRSEGTEAHVDGDALVLGLNGSEEHGCPADALEVRISPRTGAPASGVLVEVSGVAYFLLPPEPLWLECGGEWTELSFEELEELGSIEVGDWSRLGQHSEAVGEVYLWPVGEVPWFQLQHHEGLVEVDLDHSCEDPDFTGASLSLVVVPGGRGQTG